MDKFDDEIRSILGKIHELGFIRVECGRLTLVVPPALNVWTSGRWEPTITYLLHYAERNPNWSGEFFVCIYDGWREYTIHVPEHERNYVPWSEVDQDAFLGAGLAKEPRFMHKHSDLRLWPVLPRQVIAYNRHLNDKNVILIPDAEFLSTRFVPFTDQVKASDIAFTGKLSKIVWRGSRVGFAEASHYCKVPSPNRSREMAVLASLGCEYIDASFEPKPVSWMLRHKYILDIDGTVNAWSGLFWKLSSNSVILKVSSHWEQWYYNRLVPHKMYIPVDDFDDLKSILHYCEQNPSLCESLTYHAKEFVATLTYRFALEQYSLR